MGRSARIAAAAAAGALLAVAWIGPGEAQRRSSVPSWVRSVEVHRSGVTLRAGPSRASKRRGTVQRGTRLPLLSRVRGDGCAGGGWVQVGPEAFVCESLTRYSRHPPAGDRLPRLTGAELTPRRHAFVRTDATWAYGRPTDYFTDRYVEALGRGFGLAIADHRTVEGVDFIRTLRGLWVPSSELRFARPSAFAGVELAEGDTLDAVAWVVRDRACLRARPHGRVVGRASRLQRLAVRAAGARWLTLSDGRAISARDVRRPSLAAPPPEVGPGERWVDVHVGSQTLVAYVGRRPVFATLVSTGRATDTSRTPRGTFRIWVKLAEDDMDDLERLDVDHNYSIEAVPWVQYFHGSVGFHAAFWHDRFGRVRSHGCVNLSPRDARRLFEFTQPALPPGWDAILPTARHPGTVVRVR